MNTSRFTYGDTQPSTWARLFMVAVLALALQSCATTPEQTAERFNLAEVALENANLIADNLHAQGRISETDWPKVRAGLDAAAEDVAKAKAAHESDPDLDVFKAVLAELNRRLMLMQQRPSEPMRARPNPTPRGKP